MTAHRNVYGEVTVSKERWDALLNALKWALPLAEERIMQAPNIYPDAIEKLVAAKALIR